MLLNCGVGEDSWESLGLQGDPTSPFWRRSVLGVLWKEWWQSWNSSTLATSCEQLTHWKRLWCWEGLRAGGEGDNRGWDGWMASLTQWAWVWVNSGSWWWTGRPGVLRFMGLQRVGHDWATELNWTEGNQVVCFLLVWLPCEEDYEISRPLGTICLSTWLTQLSLKVIWRKQLEYIVYAAFIFDAYFFSQMVSYLGAKNEAFRASIA